MQCQCDGALISVSRRHEGEITHICSQDMISNYNSSISGRLDRPVYIYMSYYSVGRKTMKLWRRIIWRMHDHAAMNGLVVHRLNCGPSQKPLINKQFRIQLAYVLVANFVADRCSISLSFMTLKEDFKENTFHIKPQKDLRCRICAYKMISPRGK